MSTALSSHTRDVPPPGSLRESQKATQRDRLLAAIVDIAASEGYAHTTIRQIVARAGVSRPTFYDYFADKDACLLAALTAIDARLLTRVDTQVRAAEPWRATYAAVEAIVAFAHDQPAMARVLFDTSLAATTPTLDARDHGIAALALLIDDAHRAAPVDSPVLDLGSAVLIAGIYHLLGSRIRQDQSLDATALFELLAWVDSYAVPAASQRWQALAPFHPAAELAPVAEPPFGAKPLRRSEHDYPPTDPCDYPRDRLFFAAAELSMEERFDAVTVADIAKRAGVGYRRLTSLFSDKQELFSALHELGYLRTLAATTGGYFSRGPWPDRVWAAANAYASYVGSNPTLANVGFVMPYAVGPRSARLMDANLKAFTLFLREGYSHLATDRPRPSQLALDVIAATIFELGYQAVRSGKGAELPTLLPQAVFLVLAPFLGVEEAVRFVEGKLAEASQPTGS
jgi:AcrR family transcriptional regulator